MSYKSCIVLLLLSVLPSSWAQDELQPDVQERIADVVVESQPPNVQASMTDSKVLAAIEQSQQYYDQAFAYYRDGKPRKARSSIKKAYKLIALLSADEDVSQQLRSDFLSMTDKLRSLESAKSSGQATALDASDEELAKASMAAKVVAKDVQVHTIPVDPSNPVTRQYLAYYMSEKKKDVVLKAFERSGRYREIIESELKVQGLPKELLYLVMVESEFNPKAYSRAGAAGLWQLMPATARKLGLKVNYWVDERFDPELATRAALKYLKELHSWFDDWHLALAAYNRGEHGIGRDLQWSKATAFAVLSDANAMPQETRHFVPKFMACVILGENLKDYGLNPVFETSEGYDEVALEKSLDLSIAATSADTDLETIKRLNPSVRAWCTPAKTPGFIFRVPKGKKDSFLAKLSLVKDWNPTPDLVKYRVQKNDALSLIAKRYQTTVEAIKRDNSISNARSIRAGQILKIRPGKRYAESRN
ncbi:MAG: transglycosylase SLT domain-containing protein [Elusimicrobiota bacterium]